MAERTGCPGWHEALLLCPRGVFEWSPEPGCVVRLVFCVSLWTLAPSEANHLMATVVLWTFQFRRHHYRARGGVDYNQKHVERRCIWVGPSYPSPWAWS